MAAQAEAVCVDQTFYDEFQKAEEEELELLLQEVEEVALAKELAESSLKHQEIDQKTPNEPMEDYFDRELSTTEIYVNYADKTGEIDRNETQIIEKEKKEDFERVYDHDTLTEEDQDQDFVDVPVDELAHKHIDPTDDAVHEPREGQADDHSEVLLEEDKFVTADERNELREVDYQEDLIELEKESSAYELIDLEEENLQATDYSDLIDLHKLEEDRYDFSDEVELDDSDLLEVEDQEAQIEDQQDKFLEKNDLTDLEELHDFDELEQDDDLIDLEEEEFTSDELIDLEEYDDLEALEQHDDSVIGEVDNFEEQQFESLKEFNEIKILEKEFSQLPDDYESVFTPQEQFLAQFDAERVLSESTQSEHDRHDYLSSIFEEYDLALPTPYAVSFNEDLLPSISLDHIDKELSSLEEQLARLDSPRAFEHFHEQLQESPLELLTVDTHLTLNTLADELDLISQGSSLPEPPPYDFQAELELYKNDEVESQLRQLANPFYPYSPRDQNFRANQPTNPPIIRADAVSHSSKSLEPQIIPPDETRESLPDMGHESSAVFSQTISPAILAKLKVTSNRGIIEQQIEALKKLKALDHKIDPRNQSNRIITLTATSKKEMGEVLIDKMGDFTYEPYVTELGKRSLAKLTKHSWKPMANFIEYGIVEKEILNTQLNQTDWVTYSKSKSWEYTGNQRIITKVRMDLFEQYFAKLEEQARTLARDTRRTRVYLSKFVNGSVQYKEKLEFWLHYGYRLSEINSEAEKTSSHQISQEKIVQSRLKDNSAINDFITKFNANMQNLMKAGASVPLKDYESLETLKNQFPNFIPVFRYEGPYFFMENYNVLIQDIKPWELIANGKGGSYTTVFHAIEAIKERTYVLNNPFNNKTYRTMKDNAPRVTNKRGFPSMYKKVKDEFLRLELLKYNKFSPQQSNKTIWEELHPLSDVEYVLRAYLSELIRMNRISPYLKEHIKKEITHRLEGFTSITNYPPSSVYIIKVLDTEELVRRLIINNKGIANPSLKNSEKIKEFTVILDKISSEIGSISLSEIIGARFDHDRVITVANPEEFISNGKILKAFFESCSDAHINAIPRFVFQSQKWVQLIGLDQNNKYTAFNTGNTPNLNQDEVAASGRQDFTIVDEHNQTHAIAQNKLLRTEVSSGRTTYLAEIARDIVATQGFGVPGYNIFTTLNHDARTAGIAPSIPNANITYIGVSGGVKNPSLGFPKLGQTAEWAMYKAYNGKNQVTSGSNLVKEVNLKSLLKEATTKEYRSSQKTTIPTNSLVNEKLINIVHRSINSTTEPLKFLLDVLRMSINLKKNEYD